MGLIKALVAARLQMTGLTADKRATITGRNGSSFTFKYATLHNLLNLAVPTLAEQGIALVQTVSTADGKVGVTTQLRGDDGEVINSGFLEVDTDGSSRDLAGKVSHARRIQLMALLGLEASDSDEASPQQSSRPRQAGSPATPVTDSYKYKTWESQEPLRKAAQLGQETDLAHDTDDLLRRLIACDTDDEPFMSTKVAEGKTHSMYSYIAFLIDRERGEEVLSFLLGRAVHRGSPLKASHRWLVDELKDGKHVDAITEVLGLLA